MLPSVGFVSMVVDEEVVSYSEVETEAVVVVDVWLIVEIIVDVGDICLNVGAGVVEDVVIVVVVGSVVVSFVVGVAAVFVVIVVITSLGTERQ